MHFMQKRNNNLKTSEKYIITHRITTNLYINSSWGSTSDGCEYVTSEGVDERYASYLQALWNCFAAP